MGKHTGGNIPEAMQKKIIDLFIIEKKNKTQISRETGVSLPVIRIILKNEKERQFQLFKEKVKAAPTEVFNELKAEADEVVKLEREFRAKEKAVYEHFRDFAMARKEDKKEGVQNK